MELLERSDELAALHRLLAECTAGGRVAVISGEAGAGKSTLVTAFAEAAGPRAQMLWGACDPLVTPRALGPLHDIARRLGGALRDRIADGARGEVFELLLEALDRPPQAARPVVVLEDLHWADEATLDMVAYLGRRLALCRALLVLTFREEEIGPDHRLRTVLAGLPRGLVRRVSLPPLSRAAVEHLALRAGRPSPAVYEVTGGNPLLVTEVLAASASDVPPTVRDLVLSRISTLSAPAREVASLASVVPTRVTPDLLIDRLAAVDECLARGVLVGSGDGVGYRHELLRRAVEESLSPVRRAALHARVLAALTDRGVDPARLVHHAHHAGDAAAVLRWAPVAARRAAKLGAYRQAAAHYAAVVPLAAGEPDAVRAGLLEEYSLAAYHGGLGTEAIEARRAALRLREGLGDTLRIGENLRWVSRLNWWIGRPEEARAVAYRAVEVLEAQPPGRELAAAYSNLSQLFMLADEPHHAIDWGTRATELAVRCGDVATELNAMINIGSARVRVGDPDGVAELRRAHERGVAAGLDDDAGRALVNLASSAVERYDLDLAEATFDHVMPFLAARDLDGYTRHLLGHRGRLRLHRGDWAGAREDVEQALAGSPQPSVGYVPVLAVRSLLRSRTGEDGGMDDARRTADSAYPTGEAQWVCPAAAALAEAHYLAGDHERAAAEAAHGLEVALRSRYLWLAGELALLLWRCGGLSAPPAGVAEPFRLTIAGEWRAAAAEWERRECPYAQADALSTGDVDGVVEALRIFDRLGAAQTARHLRASSRERGLRVPRGPRPSTASHATGLTGRQQEVLALLADGLSNADIAARLTVSVKTVDHHVSAVLGKLGVPNRVQAAAAARRHGLL